MVIILQPIRRSLGPLRRLSRQRETPFCRAMTTVTRVATPSPPPPPPPPPPATNEIVAPDPAAHRKNWHRRLHVIRSNDSTRPIRSAFAVYGPPPSARKRTPAALVWYNAQQVRRLDRTGARTALFSKRNRDSAKVGDVLQVTTSRGEPFAGVCIAIHRSGVDTAILLRNHLAKVGTEMWYKIYSPNVLGIEIVWRRPKRARRAKLYHMRRAKHDMGNVDNLVEQWKRSRNIFSSKKGGNTGGRPGKAGKRR